MRTVLLALGVGLLLAAMVAGPRALGLPGPLDALDNYAHDRWMLERNQAVPVPGFQDHYNQVALVNIDDDSMTRIGRWPWPRSRFADLLKVLRAAGARVVAFDVLFNQKGPDDALFAAALQQRPPRPVVATLYRVTSTDDVQVDRPLDWLQPPPPLDLGAVGVTADRDGVLRHALMAVQLEGRAPLPALSLAAWCAYQNVSDVAVGTREVVAGPLRIPTRRGRVLIDWPTPDLKKFQVAQGFREMFPLCDMVSFADALEMPPEMAREVFRNRIVLVGAMAQAMKEDVKPTPLGDMPGLAIHACLLISLLQGRFLTEWPHSVELGIFLASALLLGLAMGRRLNPILSLGLAIGMYAAWRYAARWLFMWHSIVVGIATPALNAIVFIVLASTQLLQETWEKGQVRRIFGQYLSPDVVDALVTARRRGQLALEGKREKVTVLFADIRGFTALAESMTPEDVVRMLNVHFTAMTEVAVKHGGYIDKFGGDSIMVVYSAPFPRFDDAMRAARAAREMIERSAELNAKWEAEGRPRLEIGIGIDTGEVVLGSIGSPLKREYTVIGDHVNIAARLCGAAQRGQVLISGETWNEIKDETKADALPPIQLKGKSSPLPVYVLSTTQSKEQTS